MNTRGKAKQPVADVESSELSFNLDSAETAETANIVDGAPVQTQGSMSDNQLASLIASITLLKESVVELRNEAKRSQSEVQQLRQQVEESNSTEAVTASSAAHMQTSTPTPTQLPQQPLPALAPCHTMPSFVENSMAKLYPLPTFCGNPEDWPLFLASYEDTTIEFSYNNKQNLMRLQKALQGDARRSVISMLIYPNDVPKVMTELRFNFGRPDLLIRCQLQRVQQFPSMSDSRLDQILDFANCVRNIVAFFKSAKCEPHLMNPTLLEQLIAKLPASKQFEWCKFAASISSFPTVETFADWLSDLAKAVSIMPGVATTVLRSSQPTSLQPRQSMRQSQTSRQPTSSGATTRRVLHNSEVQREQQQPVCLLCGQNHGLNDCHQFKSYSTAAKWATVKQHRLCFGCLRKGHNVTVCRRKKACSIDGCERVHHQLLHQEGQPKNSAPAAEPERILNCRQKDLPSLFKVLPVVLSGPQGSLPVYAMYDEGSSISLLEEDVAAQLGLKGQYMPLTLQWYGDSQTTEKSRRVAASIKGANCSQEFSLKNIRTVKALNLPKQSFNKQQYSHLRSLPIQSYAEAKPVLLLGLDNCHLTVASHTVEAGPHQPIATATKLGWVAFGPTYSKVAVQPRILHVREAHTLKQLSRLMEEYFSVESFGVRSTDVVLESEENHHARKVLTETTKDLGQRYEVGLLWKKDVTTLPYSYVMAKQRLLNIESRMSRNHVFAANYQREMSKYLDKGYARQLTPEEVLQEGPASWYLPHFGVVNPHKPDKLRIVFDAAASVDGVSLNSVLLKGPEHAQPLMSIISKFRQGAVGVAGDIQEMFSQIRIRSADQEAQRFLWRNGNPSEPVRVFEMSSMIFGAICSPCCAEYVKNLNAAKFEPTMPRGARAIIANTYVDDLVISFNNMDEAMEVTAETIQINAAAGFRLRNFISNCKPLQRQLNDDITAADHDVVNMERQANTDKILGMFWNTNTDSFEFHFKFHKIARDVLDLVRPPTKRELLAIAMSVYDPFGLLANVTISVKILLQSLWKQQIQWDEQLPHQQALQWGIWWKQFKSAKNLAVPRCYSPLLPVADDVQLHIFVDASSNAYAAVAYLRIRKEDVVNVAFVCAKTRCAPQKGMTVPRLELQAAILGCRMKTSIEKCHDLSVTSTTFWSDSKTVLFWIRSETRQYKQFVAFRIAEILAVTTPAQWRWVPTSLNVADDATRASSSAEFDPKTRWIMGPDFLLKTESCWPQEAAGLEVEHGAEEESRLRIILLSCPGKYPIKFDNFSSYLKILRVVGWILRFIHNAKNKVRFRGELQAAELADAERVVLRRVQFEVYAGEIRALDAGQCLPKSSCLYQLTPFIDNDRLLKVNGRIDAAYCLPVTARRPIILPKSHHITRLVMEQYHRRRHHQNDCLVINELRQRFWVPRARALLKSVRSGCAICMYYRAKPAVPLMGQVPIDRLTPFVRPFSYAGVDYCGPFFVSIGRRREKRWVALFTCLTTRAIHLEVAADLSTDAFLICLRNFVNRRGVPVRIRSDNGTNFLGAQKKLKEEQRLFDFNKIDCELSRDNIQWLFNCPADPSAGGCWERLVQCVKRLLQRVLQNEAPRLETFGSVLIEAENIVNSRPLTDLPLTPQQEEPLTPNHFLVGCLNSTQTPSPDEENLCLRKQWRIAQNLKNKLWKRWTVEYLPQLLRRSKWRDETTPLKPGQLVIVCDPALPRSQWQKGIITAVITAKDGQVRTAEVRTMHGILRRPAKKLAALTSASESPE